GFDCVLGALNVVRLIDSWLVLLVNDARDENRRRWIVRIESQRAFGVLFRHVEVAFLVGLGGFVQFVLGADLINHRTSGSGSDKQTQNRCRADPGPEESHSVSSVNMKMTPGVRDRKEYFSSTAGR